MCEPWLLLRRGARAGLNKRKSFSGGSGGTEAAAGVSSDN